MSEIKGNTYTNTCEALKNAITKEYGKNPCFYPLEPCDAFPENIHIGSWIENRKIAEYLLWMLEQIPHIEDSEKRARWIGWVMGVGQLIEICTIDEVRNLIRQDCKQITVKPVT